MFVDPNSSAGGDGTTDALSGANRAFVSLNAWEAASQADLTGTGVHTVTCKANGATKVDATAVTITGWTTTSSDYIHVEVDAAYRHAGLYTTGKYHLQVAVNFGTVLTINEAYTRLTGLQVKNTHANTDNTILVNTGVASGGSDGCLFDRVIATHSGTASNRVCVQQWGSIVTYRNCLAYGADGPNFILTFAGGGAANGTFHNCLAAGGTYGFRSGSSSNVLNATNCYAGGTTTADFSRNSASGSYTTCRNEDGSDSQTTCAYSTSAGGYFTNITAGSEDFTIGASSELINIGTDLSGTFTVDIAGATRTGTWEVGPFNFAAGGASAFPHHYYQMMRR